MDPAHFYFLHGMDGNTWFSKDLSRSAEWDFVETPSGMACVEVRRIDGPVWVLVSDYIPPNMRVSPALEGAAGKRGAYSRVPWLTWGTVPVDDTNTMHIGFWWAREDKLASRDGGITRPSQRPYEQRQHLPGDDDAQVSQRPIAVHGLEHLASSDRGIIMLRNIVRWGIRAVGSGGTLRRLWVLEELSPPSAKSGFSPSLRPRLPRRMHGSCAPLDRASWISVCGRSPGRILIGLDCVPGGICYSAVSNAVEPMAFDMWAFEPNARLLSPTFPCDDFDSLGQLETP